VFDSIVIGLFLKAPCFQLYIEERTSKDRRLVIIMQIINLILLVCILCGCAILLYLKEHNPCTHCCLAVAIIIYIPYCGC